MNSASFRVLRVLADAEFHSGVDIARDLGVSRGTVWNAVRALESAGLDIYRVRSRGYRLPHAVSLLDGAAIAQQAGEKASRFAIRVVDQATSTNTLLMQRASAGAPSGTVIAAEWQDGGRGRMDRRWHAGLGAGITFSVLWRFTQGAGGLAGLSLAAGVAMVRAISSLGADDVKLKWPNDIVWRGGKLAGMLIEMHGDALGPSAVVIGIGVNVRLSEALRSRIDQPAADLETACAGAVDRSRVIGAVLRELAPVLDTFAHEGFAPLRAEWERHHAHQGREVSITLPGGRRDEGIAQGVADDGALLFASGNGVRRLHSGELSLRAADTRHGGRAGARARSRA